jgi:hypothetical protein
MCVCHARQIRNRPRAIIAVPLIRSIKRPQPALFSFRLISFARLRYFAPHPPVVVCLRGRSDRKSPRDANVNILSCLTTTSGSEGVTHVVVDKVNKAKKALANAGLGYIEADVLCIELPNTFGALAKFTGKLAEKNINITMGYATGERVPGRPVWFSPFPI